MLVLELVFALGWAAWIYWFVAAFSMKRGRIAWGQQLRIRVLVFGVAVVAVRLGAFRDHAFDTDPWRASVGIALFALGLGLAVWARRHLGRNWGTPMSQKKDPELVTTGPYRVVRHPIGPYSNIDGGASASFGGVSPTWDHAAAVAMRPRGVRLSMPS